MTNFIARIEFLIQGIFKSQLFCPHCHSNKLTVLASKYRFIKVKQCSSCYLCFTSPIYQPIFFNNLYNHFYSGEGSTTNLPSMEQLNELLKTDFQVSDKNFQKRIEAIKTYCDQNSSLLEIGSSWGYFLWQAERQGFVVSGVEIGEKRRGFGVKHLGVTIVESLKHFEKGSFDIVYTSHVLEHFTDLSTIFAQIHDLLKPNGKLIIEVPNFDWEIFGEKKLSIIGAVHPLGFSTRFFNETLPKYEFRVLGYFDEWESFPNLKVKICSKSNIILLAEKVNS